MTDFGADIGSIKATGLPPGFGRVSGIWVLGNRLLRRLQTPRGRLHYAPDFGLDIRGLIEQQIDVRTAQRWEAEIARECEKDEAVEQAKATVTLTQSTSTATVRIEIQTADGPFRLVVAVSSLTVALLEAG